MTGAVERLHRAPALLLLGVWLAYLPHALHLPLWLSLGCGALLAWRTGSELAGWVLPGRLLRLGLTLAIVAGVLFQFGTVMGRDPGVALLLAMVCLKLLEMRNRRDAVLVVFLGFFALGTVFLYSQTIWTGLYMLPTVIVLIASLVLLFRPASAGHEDQEPARTLVLAGNLVLQAIPLMVVLFLLFPRPPGPLWGIPGAGTGGVTGLSDTIRLGDIAHLSDSHEVAFRVEFAGPIPPPADRYWRGPVLWYTDGRHWLGPRGAQDAAQPAPPDGVGGLVHEVTLEPHGQQWLLALDRPVGGPSFARLTDAGELWSARPVQRRVRYTVASRVTASAQALSATERERYLQLPEGLHPRARALAAGLQADADSDGAVVAAALRHFAEGPYRYTRRPQVLGDDPVDEFLFASRRGFCEHYAVSFAVLMRAAGLPARVVTGYQGGEYNPVGDYLLVRQSDAHAWAEVWQQGAGWVRVDPTAAIPPERIEWGGDRGRFQAPAAGDAVAPWLERLWHQLDHGWDSVNHAWNRWVLGYGPERQLAVLRALGLGELSWRGMVVALLIGAALVTAVTALYLLLRRRRPARDPANEAYRRFCAKLAATGLPREPAEGPRDYGRRIARARPELASAVEAIVALYVSLRYRPGPGTADLERLRALVRRLRP